MNRINSSTYASRLPQPTKDLYRIGDINDGGYLVSNSSKLRSRSLLSFRRSFHIKFENDFVNFDSNPKIAHNFNFSTMLFLLKKFFGHTKLPSLCKFSPSDRLLFFSVRGGVC